EPADEGPPSIRPARAEPGRRRETVDEGENEEGLFDAEAGDEQEAGDDGARPPEDDFGRGMVERKRGVRGDHRDAGAEEKDSGEPTPDPRHAARGAAEGDPGQDGGEHEGERERAVGGEEREEAGPDDLEGKESESRQKDGDERGDEAGGDLPVPRGLAGGRGDGSRQFPGADRGGAVQCP